MAPLSDTQSATQAGGGFQFVWSVSDEKQISRLMGQVVEKTTDFQELWNSQAFKDIVYGSEKKQFATEGEHGSGGWAKLNEVYEARKARQYPDKPILQRTGRMFKSLTSPVSPGAVYTASRHSVTFGTTVPYAIYHQKGTKDMPERKPIEFTDGERQQIIKAMAAHVFKIQGTPVRGQFGQER